MVSGQLGGDSISNLGVEIGILVDGVNVVETLGLHISDIEVETTHDFDADTCSFTIQNIWDSMTASISVYDNVFAPGNSIEVLLQLYGGRSESVFEGLIVHVTVESDGVEGPVLEIRAVDYSTKLMGGRLISDSWVDISSMEIVEMLASAYGMTADVDVMSSPATLGVTVRADPQDNDFRFLQKLAERAGYRFYVTGQTICFKSSSMSELSSVMSFDYGRDVLSFSIRADLLSQVTSVVVQGWNHMLGVPIVGVSNPVSSLGAGMMNAWTGPTRLAMAQVESVQMVAEDVSSEEQALKRAQLIFNDHARRFVQGFVKVGGNPTVKPGCRIAIGGLGNRFGGEFECARVIHSINTTDGFTTTAILRGSSL